eukprot:3470789-Rhodomonas_salina.1
MSPPLEILCIQQLVLCGPGHHVRQGCHLARSPSSVSEEAGRLTSPTSQILACHDLGIAVCSPI